LGAAAGDKHYALRLYVWNGRLCEAFYLPMQLGEVSIRNTIQKALTAHYGADWYQRGSFTCTLPDRFKDKLSKALSDARAKCGASMAADDVVAELTFGFWVHLTTSPYDQALWPKSYALSFPNKPGKVKREDLWQRLEKLRLFRNRIAHHSPIFDHAPKSEYQNCLTLIEWICHDTKWFTGMVSRIDRVINARPQAPAVDGVS
jgi:hypothetical protein